ncbi:MAG TPA: acetate/propionate family kinase [Bryobacteraceae bacterium]|nr:acetate/propionate family kinase [Bryobacteraceae bacterium]
MNILIPNLGSTSLKYQLRDMPSEQVLLKGRLERVTDYRRAIAELPLANHKVDAVVFKAVHAGERYRGTFLIDQAVIDALQEFLPAAPAHNAIYLTGIRAFQQAMPGVPLIAAFETEFHRTMPPHAATYGVPASWRESGVRKYGFHGASHQYVSERVLELLHRPANQLKLISCHLGGSSSMCAIDCGQSVDTTMGFSPQSGLENATRHGDLDLFAAFFMMRRNNWSIDQAVEQLAQTGGLAGLSGIAGGDVRDLEAAIQSGNEPAALALRVFTYQVRKTIGAFAAAMSGLDAVAFTGGIGENSAALRTGCCQGLEFLGIHLDPARNERGQGDRIVSTADSNVAVVLLATDEELIVARRAYRCLSSV